MNSFQEYCLIKLEGTRSINEMEIYETETAPPLTLADEIHHSIADADDVEEVWDETITVGGVLSNLVQHPGQIITRWNWKSALIGALLRASFYFTVYQASRESWLVTLTAVCVELFFRFLTTGMSGAVVQSFRRAQPFWLANVIVSILLPLFSHTVEFVTHYAQERYFFDVFAATENSVARQRAFAISVLFSVLSALFNLFAMKHGVLLVGAGEETGTLWDDVKKLPRMVGEFTAYLPVLIAKFIEEGRLGRAFLSVLSFGVVVGSILGVMRGFRWQWAWTTAVGSWAILLFSVCIALFARYLFKRKGTMYRKRY